MHLPTLERQWVAIRMVAGWKIARITSCEYERGLTAGQDGLSPLLEVYRAMRSTNAASRVHCIRLGSQLMSTQLAISGPTRKTLGACQKPRVLFVVPGVATFLRGPSSDIRT